MRFEDRELLRKLKLLECKGKGSKYLMRLTDQGLRELIASMRRVEVSKVGF